MKEYSPLMEVGKETSVDNFVLPGHKRNNPVRKTTRETSTTYSPCLKQQQAIIW